MYRFSGVSLGRLLTCHDDLQQICRYLITRMDVSILEGHRDKLRHLRLLEMGRSKNPNSKHLKEPSHAVDVAPYPIVWPNPSIYRNEDAMAMARMAYMLGLAQGWADANGIPLRHGLDWDGDGEIRDTEFYDLVHMELTDAAPTDRDPDI